MNGHGGTYRLGGVVPEPQLTYDGYGNGSNSAGPSSAGSSHPPSSFSHLISTPTTNRTSLQSTKECEDEGFLSVVARWGGDDEEQDSFGGRASRMIGGKFGLSPPPPRPPPSAPPPLPPLIGGRSDTLSRASTKLASLQISRQSSTSSVTSSIPSALNLTSPRIPPRSHTRNGSLGTTPPASPTKPISPRSTSLLTPVQVGPPIQHHHPFASPNNAILPSSPVAGPSKPPRTPSRHLLQSALDLAQKAVEMDKNNDVVGALAAYREAVARLKNVMERVGVEPGKDDLDGKKRRSTLNGKTEEEGRTLRGIHDAYVARIHLLTSMESPREDDAMAGMRITTQHPSASTSTLVPPSPRTPVSPMAVSVGERTPRISTEDTGMLGIGQFMMSEPGDMSVDSITETTPQNAQAGPSRSPMQNRSSPRLGSFDRSPKRSLKGLALNVPGGIETLGAGERSTSRESLSMRDALGEGVGSSEPLIVPPPRRTSIGLGGPPSPSHLRTAGQMSFRGSSPSSSHRAGAPSISGIEEERDVYGDAVEELSTPSQSGSHTPGSLSLAQSSQRKRTGSNSSDLNRPLPPLPASAPIFDASGHVITRNRESVKRSNASFNERFSISSTQGGSVSQRRSSRNHNGSIDGAPKPAPIRGNDHSRNVSSASTTSSPLPGRRLRAKPQPGHRLAEGHPPPLDQPELAKNTGVISGRLAFDANAANLYIDTLAAENPRRPHVPRFTASGTPLTATGRRVQHINPRKGKSLLSPPPEAQPPQSLHRPFHLLRLIYQSMSPDHPGSYLTAKFHLSHKVWKPPPNDDNGNPLPIRILAQDLKVRLIESLVISLGVLVSDGRGLLDGVREGKYGERLGYRGGDGGMWGKIGEEVVLALDQLEEEMEIGWKGLIKAGVAVGAWKGKKGTAMAWGSKITKTMDKMTTTQKTFDSPERYADILENICRAMQIIDAHLYNVKGPCTPGYHALPERTFRQIESRIVRASEFVGAVLLPFMMDDLKQYMARYLLSGQRHFTVMETK